MRIRKPFAFAAAVLMTVTAVQPALGQGRIGRERNQAYRDGYDDGVRDASRDAYRQGYEDGRDGRRFSDRYGPPPPPPVAVDRDERWRARYARTYTYNDDNFYRECRQTVDPAGVIAGAALTRNLQCEDRSYAYKTYYDGFNAGRPNASYQWRNPNNGHYGDFRVADYYNDPDGFRCANYTQRIYINGQPQSATGRACQQPDGTWAIVN